MQTNFIPYKETETDNGTTDRTTQQEQSTKTTSHSACIDEVVTSKHKERTCSLDIVVGVPGTAVQQVLEEHMYEPETPVIP